MLVLADSHLGDGNIDNFIISSSVHFWTGAAVLLTMTVLAALVLRHAAKNEPINAMTKTALLLATAALAAQILLGIKLLDQGQGISQLYIHYVGGMIPMGAFLAAGWFARGDTGRSTRALAVLIAVGYVSAIMAFFIGRSFANA